MPELTPAQARAVAHRGGPLLVLGGGAVGSIRITSGFIVIIVTWSCSSFTAVSRETCAGSGVMLVKTERFDMSGVGAGRRSTQVGLEPIYSVFERRRAG